MASTVSGESNSASSSESLRRRLYVNAIFIRTLSRKTQDRGRRNGPESHPTTRSASADDWTRKRNGETKSKRRCSVCCAADSSIGCSTKNTARQVSERRQSLQTHTPHRRLPSLCDYLARFLFAPFSGKHQLPHPRVSQKAKPQINHHELVFSRRVSGR